MAYHRSEMYLLPIASFCSLSINYFDSQSSYPLSSGIGFILLYFSSLIQGLILQADSPFQQSLHDVRVR